MQADDRPDAPLTDWSPPTLPPRTPLAGQYARLEPLMPAHAAPLFDAFSEDVDGGMWRYMSVGPFATPAAYRTWLEGARLTWDPLHFAVRMADGRMGGTISLMRIDPRAGSIEIGALSFAPRLQRTRAASEAVFLLMQWSFEAGYRRVEWKCDAANQRSRDAAQRFGFRYEGIFRNATVVKGRNRDTAWYAVTDSDWPALRIAFNAWLETGNFDAGGHQRQSLRDLTAPFARTCDPGPQ